mgnify:CR=1 FL=1
MKKYLLFIFFFKLLIVKSNDFPVHYSIAGQLFPTQQSIIELHKEILKFTFEDTGSISTNVYFEFYNPTDSIINLDIAFVDEGESVNTFYRNGKWRRYTNWDYWDMEENPDYSSEIIDGPGNNIIDFKVSLDGKELDYEIKGLDKEYEEFGYSGYEILYIFNARFPPGKTIIEHSYTLLDGDRGGVLEYILTSGKQWANRKINDFTLEFHVSKGVKGLLLREANISANDNSLLWNSILQDAKLITRDNRKLEFNGHIYENTFVQFKKKDFIPNDNIFIFSKLIPKKLNLDLEYQEIFDAIIEISYNWDDDVYNDHYPNYSTIKNIRDKIINVDNKILRNSLFAFNNYKFKSEYLTNFFMRYPWYQPNKDIPNSTEIFTKNELFIWNFIHEKKFNVNCPPQIQENDSLYKILVNHNDNILINFKGESKMFNTIIPLTVNLLKHIKVPDSPLLEDRKENGIIFIKEKGASKEIIEDIISTIHDTYKLKQVTYYNRYVCYNQNSRLIKNIKTPPPPPNQR